MSPLVKINSGLASYTDYLDMLNALLEEFSLKVGNS
jgi:hypothetical protein